MVDTVTPKRRSAIMAKIRSKNTFPELAVRSYFHARGLRFKIHDRTLPGKPDIVFASRKAAVFVHGCFWHGCPRCVDGTRKVKSNSKFWVEKVLGNKERDARHSAALKIEGWTVLTIWECQIPNVRTLERLATKLETLPKLPGRLRKATGSSRHQTMRV